MALWFPLMVGEIEIGSFTARRITGTIHPDSVGTYTVQVFTGDQCWRGQVRHRYGDGAWALLRVALEAAGDLLREVPQ